MLVSVVKGYDMDNFPNGSYLARVIRMAINETNIGCTEFNAKSNWIHRTYYLPEVKAVLARYTALPVEPSEERIAFIRERHKYVTTMQTVSNPRSAIYPDVIDQPLCIARPRCCTMAVQSLSA